MPLLKQPPAAAELTPGSSAENTYGPGNKVAAASAAAVRGFL